MALVFAGCEPFHPQVSIKNDLDVDIQNVRYSGCVWNQTLKPGESTEKKDCLPDEQAVYFDVYDESSEMWLGFKSIRDFATDWNDETVLSVTDYERDGAAPGPYGH